MTDYIFERDPKCDPVCKMAAQNGACVTSCLIKRAKPKSPVTEVMVDRFLSWPLPESVCSDLCASQPGYPHRVGTNLLTAIEARQMLEHVLAVSALPEALRNSVLDEIETLIGAAEGRHFAAIETATREEDKKRHGTKTAFAMELRAAIRALKNAAPQSNTAESLPASPGVDADQRRAQPLSPDSSAAVAAKIIADYKEHYGFPNAPQAENHMHDCIMDALASIPSPPRRIEDELHVSQQADEEREPQHCSLPTKEK